MGERPGRHAGNWEDLLREQIQLHGRQFYRVAFGILRNSHASEDVCQAVLAKAWELRERIEDPIALQAWLLRVIVTESLQVLRRRKSELRIHAEIATRDDGRMTQQDRAEFREAFHAALLDLPDLTQTVVVLRLVQGMSGNEVKDVLGCSASEVSRRLHHGMDYLRERLSKTYMYRDGWAGDAVR